MSRVQVSNEKHEASWRQDSKHLGQQRILYPFRDTRFRIPSGIRNLIFPRGYEISYPLQRDMNSYTSSTDFDSTPETSPFPFLSTETSALHLSSSKTPASPSSPNLPHLPHWIWIQPHENIQNWSSTPTISSLKAWLMLKSVRSQIIGLKIQPHLFRARCTNLSNTRVANFLVDSQWRKKEERGEVEVRFEYIGEGGNGPSPHDGSYLSEIRNFVSRRRIRNFVLH